MKSDGIMEAKFCKISLDFFPQSVSR